MFMVNNIKPALTIAVIYMSGYETNKHLKFKICMQISYLSSIFEKCEFAVQKGQISSCWSQADLIEIV